MCNDCVEYGKIQTQSIGLYLCLYPPRSEILHYHFLRHLCQNILGSELIRSQFCSGSGGWSTLGMVVRETQTGQRGLGAWGNSTHSCNLALTPTAISGDPSVLLLNFCIGLKPFLEVIFTQLKFMHFPFLMHCTAQNAWTFRKFPNGLWPLPYFWRTKYRRVLGTNWCLCPSHRDS